MGLGPPILALYQQLQGLGAFGTVRNVMELGAQAVWCPRAELVRSLFKVFGKGEPPPDMLERFANWKGSARELYTALGFTYSCVDLDPSFDSINLDLNFDSCPPAHVGRYHLVTNHGTSEHLLNQSNFFQVMHDFTAADGLMIHAVPFTAHIEHGFFSYHPNLFQALARYNSYQTCGIWVGPGWQAASLIPWEKDILDYMVINSHTTHLLVVLLRKMYDRPFCTPFQADYEDLAPDDAMARYCMIVDGEQLDGKRLKQLTTEGLVAERVAQETLAIRNELASMNGKYWDVASRLAAAEAKMESELLPLKQELAASLLRFAALENVKAERLPVDVRETDAGEQEHLRKIAGRDLLAEVSFRLKRRLLGKHAS